MSDTPARHESDQPPRSTLIKWIRLNLALSSFVFGVAVATGGSLIGVGSWLSDQRNITVAQQKTNESIDTRLIAIVAGERERDRLAEAERRERDERRIRLANDMGEVKGRLGVIESKLTTLGELLTPQRPHR